MMLMRKTMDSEGQYLPLLLLPPPLDTAAVGFRYISTALTIVVAVLVIREVEWFS